MVVLWIADLIKTRSLAEQRGKGLQRSTLKRLNTTVNFALYSDMSERMMNAAAQWGHGQEYLARNGFAHLYRTGGGTQTLAKLASHLANHLAKTAE